MDVSLEKRWPNLDLKTLRKMGAVAMEAMVGGVIALVDERIFTL